MIEKAALPPDAGLFGGGLLKAADHLLQSQWILDLNDRV